LSANSRTAVLGALVGNSVLAAVKFLAFLYSGSGAMFSEAVHSGADAFNQLLLFVGLRRSLRPPDARYPYGYGGERFLFALLSAVGVFVLGCGVTVYHGIRGLIEPVALHPGWLDFGVLGLGLLMDGAVLLTALRAIRHARGGQGLLAYLRRATDPSAIAVLLEDAVAVLGVFVALAAIGLAEWTGEPRWDALGSILIGLMMGGVAFWLARKNHQLLLGHALPPEVHEQVLAFLRAQPSIRGVRSLRSRLLAAGRFRIQADLDFDGAWFGRHLEAWSSAHWPLPDLKDGSARYTEACAEALFEALGEEIDRLEAELERRFPALSHIDLEAD